MRIIAPMMILIMMTSTLAGCAGSDPDSGGDDDIDMDSLNSLIDNNLQELINNGSSNGIIRTIDFVFDLDFLWGNSPIIPGNRTNNYTTDWVYYDYPTNSERNDVFTFDCGIYYLVGSANSSNEETYWENNNNYDEAWSDNGYNNTMKDLFYSVANDETLRFTCDEDFYGFTSNSNYYSEMVYEFTIPEGFALMCLRGDYSNPNVYRSTNTTTNGISYEWSNFRDTMMIVDGIDWYCDNDMSSIGGEHDMQVKFGVTDLEENYDYRLLWSYQLVTVIPHDKTDLDD